MEWVWWRVKKICEARNFRTQIFPGKKMLKRYQNLCFLNPVPNKDHTLTASRALHDLPHIYISADLNWYDPPDRSMLNPKSLITILWRKINFNYLFFYSVFSFSAPITFRSTQPKCKVIAGSSHAKCFVFSHTTQFNKYCFCPLDKTVPLQYSPYPMDDPTLFLSSPVLFR